MSSSSPHRADGIHAVPQDSVNRPGVHFESKVDHSGSRSQDSDAAPARRGKSRMTPTRKKAEGILRGPSPAPIPATSPTSSPTSGAFTKTLSDSPAGSLSGSPPTSPPAMGKKTSMELPSMDDEESSDIGGNDFEDSSSTATGAGELIGLGLRTLGTVLEEDISLEAVE